MTAPEPKPGMIAPLESRVAALEETVAKLVSTTFDGWARAGRLQEELAKARQLSRTMLTV